MGPLKKDYIELKSSYTLKEVADTVMCQPTDWIESLLATRLTKDYYLKHIKNLKDQPPRNQSINKWASKINSYQNMRYKWPVSIWKKHQHPLTIGKRNIKWHWESISSQAQWLPVLVKLWGKRDTYTCWWECKSSCYGNQSEGASKTERKITIWLSSDIPESLPEGSIFRYVRNTCTSVFPMELFKIARLDLASVSVIRCIVTMSYE